MLPRRLSYARVQSKRDSIKRLRNFEIVVAKISRQRQRKGTLNDCCPTVRLNCAPDAGNFGQCFINKGSSAGLPLSERGVQCLRGIQDDN